LKSWVRLEEEKEEGAGGKAIKLVRDMRGYYWTCSGGGGGGSSSSSSSSSSSTHRLHTTTSSSIQRLSRDGLISAPSCIGNREG